MSRRSATNGKALKRKAKDEDVLDFESSMEILSDEIEDSPKLNKTTKMTRSRKKQNSGEEIDGSGLEMSKILKSIGADIQKNLSASKRKMQQLAQVSLKSTVQKLDDFLNSENNDRKKLFDEFSHNLENVLVQWDQDIQTIKDQNAKIQKIFAQQQKLLQHVTTIQDQRIKIFRDLVQQYDKGLEALNEQQNSAKCNIHNELNNEFSELQKKMMTENQQQRMEKMKKSLFQMF